MQAKVLEWKRLATRYGQRVLAELDANGQRIEVWGSADLPDKAPGDEVAVEFDASKQRWKFAGNGNGNHANSAHSSMETRIKDVHYAYEELKKLVPNSDGLAILQLAVLLVKG